MCNFLFLLKWDDGMLSWAHFPSNNHTHKNSFHRIGSIWYFHVSRIHGITGTHFSCSPLFHCTKFKIHIRNSSLACCGHMRYFKQVCDNRKITNNNATHPNTDQKWKSTVDAAWWWCKWMQFVCAFILCVHFLSAIQQSSNRIVRMSRTANVRKFICFASEWPTID